MEYVILAVVAVVLVGVSWYRSAVRNREGDREGDARGALRRRIEQDPANLAAEKPARQRYRIATLRQGPLLNSDRARYLAPR